MRDMANPNDTVQPSPTNKRGLRLLHARPWVQTAFVVLWAMPLTWISQRLGAWGRTIPSCVFHCYFAGGSACPAASLSCPIGIAAQFSAIGVVPLLVIGVLLLAGATVGSLVCGWACPFGFIQDLLAKVPLPKFRIPRFMSYGRFAVLLVLVIALPYAFGVPGLLSKQGLTYEKQTWTTICAWCPAGAVEGAIPSTIKAAVDGQPERMMSDKRAIVLAAFVLASLLTFRPWCTVLCPLGGFLSLFNRLSIFHLRFKGTECTSCNTCRSRCDYGVLVDVKVNDSRCIRCLECTSCGAIAPATGLEEQASAHKSGK